MNVQSYVDDIEYLLSNSFVNHRKYNAALSVENQKVVFKGKQTIITTACLKIYCEWKDGFTSWEKLSNVQELHPLQVAEYAVAQDIHHKQHLVGRFTMSWRKKTDNILSEEMQYLVPYKDP